LAQACLAASAVYHYLALPIRVRPAPMAQLLQQVLSAGLLAGVASFQQEMSYQQEMSLATSLQQEMSYVASLQQEMSSSAAFWNMFGALPDDAPDWCRSEEKLSWEEKRHRVEQRATLQWARQQVQGMIEKNQTVPEWMDEMVARSTQQGQMKWAAREARRLRHEKKSVPEWMAAMEEEDDKWANRWAACKVSELEFAGTESPEWMKDNGRKAVYASAMAKLAEIQEQIDELESLKEKEVALMQARGDIRLAEKRQLLAHRPAATTPHAPSEVKATNSTKVPHAPAKVEATKSTTVLHVPSGAQASTPQRVLDLSEKRRRAMSMISQAAADVEGDDRRVALTGD